MFGEKSYSVILNNKDLENKFNIKTDASSRRFGVM